MKIEKDIPAPECKPRAKSRPWPFSKMEVGDSVLIDARSDRSPHKAQAYCHVYAAQKAKSGVECKFTSRKEGDGIRVWRIA